MSSFLACARCLRNGDFILPCSDHRVVDGYTIAEIRLQPLAKQNDALPKVSQHQEQRVPSDSGNEDFDWVDMSEEDTIQGESMLESIPIVVPTTSSQSTEAAEDNTADADSVYQPCSSPIPNENFSSSDLSNKTTGNTSNDALLLTETSYEGKQIEEPSHVEEQTGGVGAIFDVLLQKDAQKQKQKQEQKEEQKQEQKGELAACLKTCRQLGQLVCQLEKMRLERDNERELEQRVREEQHRREQEALREEANNQMEYFKQRLMDLEVQLASPSSSSSSSSAPIVNTLKEESTTDSTVDSNNKSFLSTQSSVEVIDIKPVEQPLYKPLSQAKSLPCSGDSGDSEDDEMILDLLQSQHEQFTKSLVYSSNKAKISSGSERIRYEQQVDSITANLSYLDDAIALHVSKMNQVISEPTVSESPLVPDDTTSFDYYTEKHVRWADSDDESSQTESDSESQNESETESDTDSEQSDSDDVCEKPKTVIVPVEQRSLSTAETCWPSTYRELISMGFEPTQFESILTDCFGNLEATVSRLLV